jgi:hypothetical protein
VTATGIVIPTGGTGQKGTTLADAFTETAPSGIGTYTLSAKASDGAGNSSISTPVTESTFQVTYSIEFTKQEQSGNLNNQNSAGHFAFTVHRSHGVFMYDKTVVVELVRSTAPSVPVATHTIEGNGINAAVQIDDTTDPANPEYKTHFKRADLNPTPPTGPDQYKVIVSFRDVDGNLVKQAESIIVKF